MLNANLMQSVYVCRRALDKTISFSNTKDEKVLHIIRNRSLRVLKEHCSRIMSKIISTLDKILKAFT